MGLESRTDASLGQISGDDAGVLLSCTISSNNLELQVDDLLT